MTKNLVALGWTEEVTACDCCGKSQLKGTMALECVETNEVVYYGSTCATRNTGRKKLTTEANNHQLMRQREFNKRLEEHPASVALRARMQEGYRLEIAPGRTFRDFLGDALIDAEREAAQALKKEFGLDGAWKRRA